MITLLLKKHNVIFNKLTDEINMERKTARGGGLANFLDTFVDIDSISEGLANVDYYLDGGSFDYEKNTVSSDLYTAWLDNDSVDIYPSTGDTEILLQSLPLEDFRIILKHWQDFLQEGI